MSDLLRKELYYQVFSKAFFCLLIFVIGISCYSGYLQVKEVPIAEDILKQSLKIHLENGDNIKKALKQKYIVTEQEDGSIIVDNPLPYFRDEYFIARAALAKRNVVNQYLTSMIFLIFPWLLSAYSIYVCLYDHQYRTLPVKYCREGYFGLHFSKIFSLLITTVVTLAVGIFFFFVSTKFFALTERIYKTKIGGKIRVDGKAVQAISFLDKAVLQVFFFLGICLINIILFYALALATKSKIISLLCVGGYLLLIPKFGAYDFRTVIVNIYREIFVRNVSVFSAPRTGVETTIISGMIAIAAILVPAALILWTGRRKKLHKVAVS